MSACKDMDPRVHDIASSIRVVPNFPKPGIMFQDITTLLLNPKAFKDAVDLFVERYKGKNISVVAGIEARGFIFGPPIALEIGAKFVPLRKPRKLPGEVISEEYVLEYGTDCIEMHIGAVEPGERALIVDDLIATGGTLCAAMKLLERAGAEVVECACVIGLPELKKLINSGCPWSMTNRTSNNLPEPVFNAFVHDTPMKEAHFVSTEPEFILLPKIIPHINL
ncbi:Adenine phosphoribosyltransferase 1 [Acorus calamus]|uniref:adenine phosphoribosyltransferase n=1 Tax=Acorus calamus TaxID=4465 RepID=A0AAV9DTL4_ACOCL|nr:Adenine phosphoribosyltransferase 1 [Acorus calamus]